MDTIRWYFHDRYGQSFIYAFSKAFVPVVGAGNRVNDMQSEAFTNGLL